MEMQDKCSFCGRPREEVDLLIAGVEIGRAHV